MEFLTKRSFFVSLLALFLAISGCGDGSDRALVVTSYGGEWQEAQKKTMFDPFENKTGINVIGNTYNGQYGQISSQTSQSTPKWDVVDVTGSTMEVAQNKGDIIPIEYSIVDTSNLQTKAIDSHGVGVISWSWVIAYNTNSFTKNQPDSWSDFFNVEKYPGSRGFRNDPRMVLESALLADGVSPDSLYPLDVDRAFNKLDQLVSDLERTGEQIVWWDTFARPQKLLADEEVVMSAAINGRVVSARREEGLPINYTWNQGILGLDWWVVLKGTANKEQAMQFINFASSKGPQSQMPLEIPYGPTNTSALKALPDSTLQRLPTYEENLEKQVVFDREWWQANFDRIQERWNKWYTSRGK